MITKQKHITGHNIDFNRYDLDNARMSASVSGKLEYHQANRIRSSDPSQLSLSADCAETSAGVIYSLRQLIYSLNQEI